jgi:hypothetical protein
MKNLILGVLPTNGLQTGRVYTTCRNGDKWFVDVNVGDTINVVDGQGNLLGEAVIVFQECNVFDSIPPIWATLNYDPDARTLEGLYAAMTAAYPNGWNEEEVTTLGFMLL